MGIPLVYIKEYFSLQFFYDIHGIFSLTIPFNNNKMVNYKCYEQELSVLPLPPNVHSSSACFIIK